MKLSVDIGRLNGTLYQKLTRAVSQYELALFLSQLQVLYESGVPVLRALKVIADGIDNFAFKKIILEIRNDLRRGGTFFQSLSRFSEVFDPIFLNVIKIGEAIGDMGLVLKKLSELEKRKFERYRKIRAMMIYPLFVFIISLFLLVFLSNFLFNCFLPILQNHEVKVDTITKVLINFVKFFNSPFVILTLLFFMPILIFFLIRKMAEFPFIIEMRDRIFWSIPLFGHAFMKIEMTRFCYNLCILQESGISIHKALIIIAESNGNTFLRGKLFEVIEFLRNGEELWKSLEKCAIFPKIVLQLVRTGESTGKLSLCMRKLVDYYETELDYSIQNLTSALEPVVISMMGLLVGGIVFFVISPIYKIIGTFGY